MSENTEMIIHVAKDEYLYAIIVKASFKADGINFLTPNEFSQQLAVMYHPTGKIDSITNYFKDNGYYNVKVENSFVEFDKKYVWYSKIYVFHNHIYQNLNINLNYF